MSGRKSILGLSPAAVAGVYGRMGYIALLVVAVIVIPLVFMLFAKRPTASGQMRNRDNGVTRAEPASDEPTPRSGSVNKINPDVTKRIPPG